ncbi:hypothetical protein [Raineya orbicola]|uniref:Uncharacterized protein n=1 Tax=Raineya orbicola TaxID=2016530 RepID=A0A2N3IIW0_9BACT|nr:hypothetical protein [Raineya orbicola]PKQ70211.1 hypothetical protein Rain11_0732 [Raineya orbicola]
MKYLFYITCIWLIFACNRKPSTCAAYQEVGTVAIPEDGYVPTNFIITERHSKTGLVKKVGGVSKKKHKTRAEQSKIFRKEKKFIKDKELFPDNNSKATRKKKSKKSKRAKNANEEEQEQPEKPEENPPALPEEKQEPKKDGN